MIASSRAARWALCCLFSGMAASAPVCAESGGASAARDHARVVEFHWNPDGAIRYELNEDIVLGMSLALPPLRILGGRDRDSVDTRWHPVFNLLSQAEQSAAFLLPEQSSRPSWRTRWFLTFGARQAWSHDDDFSIQEDFSRHFSLRTQAGFLAPIGGHWVVGGAITVEHLFDDGARNRAAQGAGGVATGAYLGVKFRY